MLSMFNRDRNVVVPEFIARKLRMITITTPDTVITFEYPVIVYVVTAECYFYSICWGVRKIISRHHVSITSAFPGIHRCLTRPKKEAITTMCNRILIEDILVTLLVH